MRRFFRLTPRRRALLIEAVIRLWAARLTLTFLPFGMWRKSLAVMMMPVPPFPDGLAWWRDAAWAVNVARRVVPNATCLVQAIAGYRMGAQHGYPSRLFIGIAAKPGGNVPEIEAHAWLEAADVVILGYQTNMQRFTRLPQIPSERGGMTMNFR